ncbi:universal stress protein YxiE-like [Ciona intestinalis]
MKVLISVDGSEIAEKAFEWYLENFHKSQNEIVVGHVVEKPSAYHAHFAGGAVSSIPKDYLAEEIPEEIQREFQLLKKKYDAKLKNREIKYKLVFEATQDKLGEAIVKMVDKEHCGAIVTGSRGMGMIKRAILGSVSDYVMHNSKVPVLIYHA